MEMYFAVSGLKRQGGGEGRNSGSKNSQCHIINKELGLRNILIYCVWKIDHPKRNSSCVPLKYKLGCKSGCAGGTKFCMSFDLVPKDALSEKSTMTLHNKVHAKWI